jgi:hypothetical protein
VLTHSPNFSDPSLSFWNSPDPASESQVIASAGNLQNNGGSPSRSMALTLGGGPMGIVSGFVQRYDMRLGIYTPRFIRFFFRVMDESAAASTPTVLSSSWPSRATIDGHWKVLDSYGDGSGGVDSVLDTTQQFSRIGLNDGGSTGGDASNYGFSRSSRMPVYNPWQ